MGKTKKVAGALHYIIPLAIILFTFLYLKPNIQKFDFMTSSLQSVEEGNETVKDFMGATIATSVAISALPDDFGTPLADTVAGLNKYFVLILILLFIEKLIITKGVAAAVAVIIPAACVGYIAGAIFKKPSIKILAAKLAILGAAVIFVVPCCTKLVDVFGQECLTYVDETIQETQDGSGKVNEIMASNDDDETVLDMISNAFGKAIKGANDLFAYFKNNVKKCINAVALLVAVNFAPPILVFLVFKWLFRELFSLDFLKIPARESSQNTEYKGDDKDEK